MSSTSSDAPAGGQPGTGGTATAPSQADQLKAMLFSPGYIGLLLLGAVIGVPISLVAFGFVSLEHELQHWIWESLPDALGYIQPPWWWPLPALTLAGLLIAPVVTRMPGKGGHIPVVGMSGPTLPPKALPSVILAALIALPLGASLGPEAPLMAIGGCLALYALQLTKREGNPTAAAVLAAAGSCAAIATIFGSPLVAAMMLLEGAGLAGPQLVLLILPCLLSSGVGALVFTGFGHWTGLGIGSLALPAEPSSGVPKPGDFLWGIPVAALIALVVVGCQTMGWQVADWTRQRTAARTLLCAIGVGVATAAYALSSGRSPEEAALSGQATLAQLAANPAAWSVGVLVLLVLFKGLAWGISLGSLRGGPIFPAIMVGAAIGLACAGLPGFGTASGLSVGLAASGAAITGLPVTATLLAALLIGGNSADAMPLLMVSAVVGYTVSARFKREPRSAGRRVEPVQT